jgi:hypothetical protein
VAGWSGTVCTRLLGSMVPEEISCELQADAVLLLLNCMATLLISTDAIISVF